MPPNFQQGGGGGGGFQQHGGGGGGLGQNASSSRGNNHDPVRVAKTIFVDGVPLSVSEETLATFFSMCGAVFAVRLTPPAPSGDFRRAWVEFDQLEAARLALQYDSTVMGGSTLRVSASRSQIHTNGLRETVAPPDGVTPGLPRPPPPSEGEGGGAEGGSEGGGDAAAASAAAAAAAASIKVPEGAGQESAPNGAAAAAAVAASADPEESPASKREREDDFSAGGGAAGGDGGGADSDADKRPRAE